MAKMTVEESSLVSVADALRAMSGQSGQLTFPAGFIEAAQAVKIPMEVYEITLASDLGGGTNSELRLLDNIQFIKERYANEGFAALVVPKAAIAGSSASTAHSIYHGNWNLGSTGVVRYGFCYISTSATAVATIVMTVKVSGTGWNVSLRARSSGYLQVYVASNRHMKAGSYIIVLMDWSDLL